MSVAVSTVDPISVDSIETGRKRFDKERAILMFVRWRTGASHGDIGKEFNLSARRVCTILHDGESRGFFVLEREKIDNQRKQNSKSKRNLAIYEQYLGGMRICDLARKYRIADQTVHQIISKIQRDYPADLRAENIRTLLAKKLKCGIKQIGLCKSDRISEALSSILQDHCPDARRKIVRINEWIWELLQELKPHFPEAAIAFKNNRIYLFLSPEKTFIIW